MLVAEGTRARHVRVLVVDSNEVLGNGLRWLLTRVPWVERCALRDEPVAGYDLALVDVGLGLPLCERIAATGARTALLASRWDDVPLRTARAAGAHGVIAREAPARDILNAVRELARGGTPEPAPAPHDAVRFTPREREILRQVGAGLTNAEIGAHMFLAPGTVKHHMLGIYDKLGARNRAGAVHAARRLGIVAEAHEPFAEPAEPLRVLVADPVDVRRAGILLWLHGRPWVAACAGARTLEDTRAMAARLTPELILAGAPELALPGVPTLALRDDGTIAQPVGTEPSAGVSPRERDVLFAFAAGATNPVIARDLGLSPNTVKQHASSIFRKLGVRNRAEAVARADELGLLAA
ncbi:response regulator transcription factor [Solirubrobacter sp. CPCC 204708]|uniref:LuxR C-terminal-related transcriptional regulator n=1 Tax=Solirubrobacter deserti TaxID=2282478 RepID=A0ABT4RH61_9ACTN|nr:LuxR C-terminal-related transcriptional regulator [Solirubrobacter deserti]MBE2315189.1 response regulator transcription factor [Solirubrobacter deserti]MDA0137872.1 LuxR C-terminal-related transcriptional regulator [Solirubrobacter deserti]